MNERALYPEITRSFKRAGGFARKAHDAFFKDTDGTLSSEPTDDMSFPDKGIADYICLLPPLYGLAVEVKYDPDNFNLNEINSNQRAFLNEHESQAFLWLGMGIRNTRKTWLVPWRDWKRVEQTLKSYNLAGLPLNQPHRIELRGVVDAPILLAPYELRKEIVMEDQHRIMFWNLSNLFNS
jgi:hypothetical protein